MRCRNVAEGTRFAALKGKPGEVYFLTDGAPVVFEDFVTQVLETQVTHNMLEFNYTVLVSV